MTYDITGTNYMTLPGLLPGIRFYSFLSPDHIISIVTDFLEVNKDRLTLKTRRRTIVEARQIAMYLIKKNSRLSLKHIGELFGSRDHTTVLHSINTVKNLCFSDEQYKQRLLQIENLL